MNSLRLRVPEPGILDRYFPLRETWFGSMLKEIVRKEGMVCTWKITKTYSGLRVRDHIVNDLEFQSKEFIFYYMGKTFKQISDISGQSHSSSHTMVAGCGKDRYRYCRINGEAEPGCSGMLAVQNFQHNYLY